MNQRTTNPMNPVPSLRHLQPRAVYDFETDTPVYSSCGVPTYSVHLLECPVTGTRFRIPPTNEALAKLHDEGYQRFYGESSQELAVAHTEKLTERVHFLRRYLNTGRVLDIGCSIGLLMEQLARAGFEPYGCDVSSDACNATAAKFDKERLCQGDAFAALRYFGGNFFDAVTLMDVIEHFQDAAAALQAVHGLLKPDGVVFLRTPSLASPFFRIADLSYQLTFGRYKRAVQTIYHAEHIYFFTEAGLRMLLEETGFEVLTVAPDPLPWRTFRLAELNHGFAANAALAAVYFWSRMRGGGHGIKVVARRVS
ncbi:MAG TPA: class I SAM-dependent methyltransferase [Candidatus Hydrogenedentes bacterium]|nr:class I SAM-dependent methyltransferase [Candidatus Hydrogenedentota bacterium]